MKFTPGDMLRTTVMEAVTGEAIDLPGPKRLVISKPPRRVTYQRAEGAELTGRAKHPSLQGFHMRASQEVIDPRLVCPDCELRGRSKPFQLCTASSTFAVSVCMLKLASLSPRTVQTWAKAAENDRPVFLKVPE